jgi:hypothetical protein
MSPVVRTILLTVGTGGGAALATAMFLATKGGDISALISQVNVVVVEVGKLFAIATPLITGGYAIWRATSTKSKIADVQSDGKVAGVIVNDQALANELGPKVVTPAEIHMLPATARAIGSLGTEYGRQ